LENKMKIEILKELISVANRLDKKGLTKEADYLDSIIRIAQQAGSQSKALTGTVTFNFTRSESEIDTNKRVQVTPTIQGDLRKLKQLINKGMQDGSPRGFIQIEVGTSATGSTEGNKSVLKARVDAALKLIVEELNSGSQLPAGPAAQPGMALNQPYNTEALLSKAQISYDMSTVGKGGHIGQNVAPGPDDPYWDGYQFVRVTVTPNPEPNYRGLATEMRTSIDNITPNYAELPYADGALPITSLTYILEDLRNKEDFKKFDDEFRAQYGKCFHQAACEGLANFNGLSFSIPWPLPPFTKPINIPAMPIGPLEIGENSEGINSELRRLGVPQIDCSTRPVKCPPL
jgi:hypothetical protein